MTMGISDGTDEVARTQDGQVRRALLRRWVRGLFTIAIILAMPAACPGIDRAINPNVEREEQARMAERLQRAAGERFVTASGDTLRAVVYTPAHPSDAQIAAGRRGLVWWSRILAIVVGLGLLESSWRILRRRPA